jgi:peptidoglycan/LPS O-acetylase OafA/YrhL
MGWVRFLLAAFVVMGHAGPNTPIAPTIGALGAVEAFFLISGFYMAAAFVTHYRSARWAALRFWSSRFTRLYPFYLFVLVLSTLAWWAVGSPATNSIGVNTFFQNPSWPLAAVNLTMIGLDIISVNPSDHLHLIARQAWSISAELVFYALVPLFCVFGRGLAAIAVVAFAAKFLLLHNFGFALGYYPFFSQLGYFCLGMLVYSHRAKFTMPNNGRLPLLLGFTAFAIASPPSAFEASINLNLCLILVLCCILPTCFSYKEGRFSRFLGDISYGVYLIHLLAIEVCLDLKLIEQGDQSFYPFYAVMVLSVLVASLFEVTIQPIVDEWRRRVFYATRPPSTLPQLPQVIVVRA